MEKNTVTIETLVKGQMLLVSAKAVKGDKVQLEFAQLVQTGATNNNVLGMLNESDDRFNVSKARRAYLSAVPADIKKHLGIDVSDLTEVGMEKELNILNPTIGGQALNIQILETTKGTEWDVANFDKSAKRAGKDGDFITTASGEYIYQKLTVVTGEATHTLVSDTKRVSAGSDIEKMIKNS